MNFKFLFRQTGKLILYFLMELRSFYWKLPFNRTKTFSIQILPQYAIKYIGRGDISQILFKTEVMFKYKKSFEYSTLELFSNILKSGNVILDVGANSGLYSILYSKLVGRQGAVHAFEPDPNTLILLKENLQINNCENVTIYDFALSNKASKIQMVAIQDDEYDAFGGDSFNYIKEISSANDNSGINAYRLDDLEQFKNIQKIDYIKIDVEGAELLVLQGSLETIRKYKPVIIFELSGKWTKRFNYKPYEIMVLLRDLGYEMEEYDFEQWMATPLR